MDEKAPQTTAGPWFFQDEYFFLWNTLEPDLGKQLLVSFRMDKEAGFEISVLRLQYAKTEFRPGRFRLSALPENSERHYC